MDRFLTSRRTPLPFVSMLARPRCLLPSHVLGPPPFLRQCRLASLLPNRFCLGFRPRLRNGSRLFRRSCLKVRLQRPLRRKTRCGKIARQSQLLHKFFLPDQIGRRFRSLVGARRLLSFFKSTGSLSTRGLTPGPFLFRDKQPDRPHQVLRGDINIPFPENLRNPANADPAAVGFQNLFLAFP
jgi:hypothetical protein